MDNDTENKHSESNEDGQDAVDPVEIEKQFKWSQSNTKLETVLRTTETSKGIYSCDSRQIAEMKNNCILFAAVPHNEEGTGQITVSKIMITTEDFKCSVTDNIILDSARLLAVAISPLCKYIACGGLDNCVTIFTKNTNNNDRYQQTKVLESHSGYVSDVKFIQNEKGLETLVLSASGDATVILWDIETGNSLLVLDNIARGDIECLDHIFLEGRHIIAFGAAIDAKIYIRDITEAVTKYENESNECKDSILKDSQESVKVASQSLSDFATDVNSVSFSPNGEFCAATADDATYVIYTKNYKHDSFWDVTVLEWTFLCRRSFATYGTAVSWVDNETLMVGSVDTKELYCTYIKRQTGKVDFIEAVTNGVQSMIKSLPAMNPIWIGLCQTVANEILQYFVEYDIFDYRYKFSEEKTRASCLTSCKWNNESNQYVVMFGSWDSYARAIIPQ